MPTTVTAFTTSWRNPLWSLSPVSLGRPETPHAEILGAQGTLGGSNRPEVRNAQAHAATRNPGTHRRKGRVAQRGRTPAHVGLSLRTPRKPVLEHSGVVPYSPQPLLSSRPHRTGSARSSVGELEREGGGGRRKTQNVKACPRKTLVVTQLRASDVVGPGGGRE